MMEMMEIEIQRIQPWYEEPLFPPLSVCSEAG